MLLCFIVRYGIYVLNLQSDLTCCDLLVAILQATDKVVTGSRHRPPSPPSPRPPLSSTVALRANSHTCVLSSPKPVGTWGACDASSPHTKMAGAWILCTAKHSKWCPVCCSCGLCNKILFLVHIFQVSRAWRGDNEKENLVQWLMLFLLSMCCAVLCGAVLCCAVLCCLMCAV